jgi:hypothetical protein
VNARLRYAVFRFAAAGFFLIEKVRLLLDEDEQCTVHNLESGLGVSHITSVLDEIEEALRSLSESEATREFATRHEEHLREMRSSFIRFLSPEVWEGSAWQRVCLEVEARAVLREAAASDRSLADQYTQFVDGITSTVLKGFPEQLVDAEGLKLLPEMLQPFFSLAQKISEFHRESQVMPSAEFNVAGKEYLFVKERIPELTEYVEACQRLQPKLSDLFPVSIDHRTDPMWWLFDFRSRVQERLRELSLDATLEATANEKVTAPVGGSEDENASPSSDPNDAEAVHTEFSWQEVADGLSICGVVVELGSELEVKVLRRLCMAQLRLTALDLAKFETPGDESAAKGIRTLLTRIRKRIQSSFGIGYDPISTPTHNAPGRWRLEKELLTNRANELRKANCQPCEEKRESQ